jgi:hypothetical protein
MENQLFPLRETAMSLRSQRPLHVQEMLVIPVYRVVDPTRIIGKNGGPRRRRGERGH